MDLFGLLTDGSTSRVLIAIGVLLILLYFVGRLGDWIALPDARRKPALFVGAGLVAAGLVLELVIGLGGGGAASRTGVAAGDRPAQASSSYYVVMGSFVNRSGAVATQRKARQAGFDAAILSGETLGLSAGNFVVATGPFSRADADGAVARTKVTFQNAYLKTAP